MPKWVWNPFEGDVTLPYMCACVLMLEEKEEEKEGIVSFQLDREQGFWKDGYMVEEKNILKNLIQLFYLIDLKCVYINEMI